jgi:predicted molibdopterin-dependent oxidoreductase YjgC
MHVDKFVRGKGRFIITQYVATDEKVTRRFPLLLTTGRILSQYNVGAQTRRTTTTSGTAKTGWRSTRTTPRSAASRTATGWASRAARARRCCAPR